MIRKTGSGAIGMLLAMLIIALLFILMMPTLKDVGGAGLSGSSLNKESVEEHVNKQVEEIERMRQQTININQNIKQEYE